jgi:transposase
VTPTPVSTTSAFYDTRISPDRKKRNQVHHLEALGFKVTLEPAA